MTLDLVDGRVLALAAGALAAVGFARQMVIREAAGRAGPFARFLAERHEQPASDRLSKLERLLDLATISAGDAHHVLRPLVIDTAGTWLAGAHGIGLDDQRAEALLPPDAWAFAAPTSRRPDDPHAPGMTLEMLDRLIGSLETLR